MASLTSHYFQARTDALSRVGLLAMLAGPTCVVIQDLVAGPYIQDGRAMSDGRTWHDDAA